MNIIILCDDKKFYDLLCSNLCLINNTNEDFNIMQAKDDAGLKSLITLFPDTKIICQTHFFKNQFIEKSKEIASNIPIFNSNLKNPSVIAKLLYDQVPKSDFTENFSNTKLTSVNLNLLYYLSQAPCDIYIKIKKQSKENNNQNEFKYLKRFNKSDGIEQSDIRIYEQRGVLLFYITQVDKVLFFKLINQRLSDVIPIETSFSRINDVQEFILNQVKDVGISPILLKIANESTSESIKQISNKKSLLSMLKDIMTSFNDYRYQHSYMALIFCNLILKKFDWATKQHFQDVATAAFFHDISLDTEEEMKIHTEEDFQSNRMISENSLKIERHANNAYLLLKTNDEMSTGALRIIKEHHGDPHGEKIQDDISKSITKLSKTFILAEFIANEIIISKQTSLKNIIKSFTEHYDILFYKQELEALKKAM